MAKFWHNNKGIIVFIILMSFFRSAVADWYHVPSGSMHPNILIGDRVLVDKLAYDVKVPFTDINLKRHDEPDAGDVVVFQSSIVGERLIKRVVGIPGDQVSMSNNHLNVNGEWLAKTLLESSQTFDIFMQDREQAIYVEESVKLKTGEANSKTNSYPVRLNRDNPSRLNSFSEVIVPEDYLLVLGDNRDNSSDSRVIGMIPRSELIGKAERVVISFDSDNFYLPRAGRFWQNL